MPKLIRRSRTCTAKPSITDAGARSYVTRVSVITGIICRSTGYLTNGAYRKRGTHETGRRVLAADAAQGQGPDRPGLRRPDRHPGAGRRGRLLARALHPRLPRGLWRDPGALPDQAAGRAGLRTAPLGQPDRDRNLPSGRLHQPWHVQRAVRRDHRHVPDRVPATGGRTRRARAHPRLLHADVANRPAGSERVTSREAQARGPTVEAPHDP